MFDDVLGFMLVLISSVCVLSVFMIFNLWLMCVNVVLWVLFFSFLKLWNGCNILMLRLRELVSFLIFLELLENLVKLGL